MKVDIKLYKIFMQSILVSIMDIRPVDLSFDVVYNILIS